MCRQTLLSAFTRDTLTCEPLRRLGRAARPVSIPTPQIHTPMPLSLVDLRDPAARTQHRDLAHIAANQTLDGVPVINRTKTLISPFADIVKTPSYSENSGQLTGYSVEIEDDAAPHGFRHMGNVSERYLLMTNAEVRALGLEIARASGLPFRETRIFFDGGRFAHVVDFGDEVAQDVSVAGDGSDPVGLSLVMRSSYDQSWRFEAALMGKRFLCDNGLLSGEFFARVSFKHTTGSASEDWRGVVRDGMRLVHRAPHDLARFAGALRVLRQAQTSDRRLREVLALFPQFGDSLVGKITRRYAEAEEATLFGLLQAGTHVLWHNPKQTAADWSHNEAFVTGLVEYAGTRLN